MADVVTNPDCSELAATVARIILNIGSEKGYGEIDKSLAKLNADMRDIRAKEPEATRIEHVDITRQEAVDAINEATTRRARVRSEEKENMARMKREARTDEKLHDVIEDFGKHAFKGTQPEPIPAKKSSPEAIKTLRKERDKLREKVPQLDEGVVGRLEKRITELEGHAKAGTLPPKIQPKLAVDAHIAALRATRDGLLEQIHNSEPAVRARLEAQKPALEKAIKDLEAHRAAGTAPESVTRERPIVEEIAQLREARTHLLSQIRAKQGLEERIAALNEHLANGTVPPKDLKTSRADADILALREKRDAVIKALNNSQPAIKERLTQQINDMTKRLEEGISLPEVKPPVVLNKENERLEFQRDKQRAEIRTYIRNLRPKTTTDKIIEPVNFQKTILASFDLSAPLRQGRVAGTAHPIVAIKAVQEMFKAAKSEQYAWRIQKDIDARQNRPLMERAGLDFSGLPGADRTFGAREEMFQSGYAEKVPGVAASERAYVSYLNLLRADVFDIMANSFAGGEPTLEQAKEIATFINDATGRSHLGPAEPHAKGLSFFLWSPRLVVSRLAIVLGRPLWKPLQRGFKTGDWTTSKAIGLEYGKYLAGTAAMYALASQIAGVKITFDPRDSDFGKIVIGNTHLDPLAGLSQATVFLARSFLGQRKSDLGAISSIRGAVKYGQPDWYKTASDFARNKLAPGPSLFVDIMSGANAIGQPITAKSLLTDRTVPLAWQDMYKVMKDQGVPKGLALQMLSVFGEGLQVYDPPDRHKTIERYNDAITAAAKQKDHAQVEELKRRRHEFALEHPAPAAP